MFDKYSIRKRELAYDAYNNYYLMRLIVDRLSGMDEPRYVAVSIFSDPQLLLDKEFRELLYEAINKNLNLEIAS